VISGLRRFRTIPTTRMGANSPTLPIAISRVPKRPSDRPASRTIGSSVPSAVVVRARPITISSMTVPISTSVAAIAMARTSEMIHPLIASWSGRPRTRERSSSRPARNIRNDRPIEARPEMTPLVCARPSTLGPITMPRTISTTTPGIASRPVHFARMGARTATIAIRSSVLTAPRLMSASFRCRLQRCHSRPGRRATAEAMAAVPGAAPPRYDAGSIGLFSDAGSIGLFSRAGVAGFMNLPTTGSSDTASARAMASPALARWARSSATE
jgi:hypothetical protein